MADVKAPKGACEAPKAPGITPITKVLVSNRGEIARRIMRTARDMGIATVAVYADGDSDAPFVREADVAIALRGRTSAETYLNIDKMIDACRRSGADAVHPGYGFLSENAAFARAVIDAGLRWIGPSPDVIAQMGDKLSAKRLMQAAGVPTLPAIALTPTTNLAAAAREIGYPVLVKASAGGGGRGMRIVETRGSARRRRRERQARGRQFVRRRHGLSREVADARAPRRNTDSRRPARQRRALLRTRVFDPASPSEDHRGSAVAAR